VWVLRAPIDTLLKARLPDKGHRENDTMSDESDNKQQELKHIQDALKEGTVSRRHFLDRMKGLGVGFGAAFLLGMKEADAAIDSGVNVKSTNPAIDDIVKEGHDEQALEFDPDDPNANQQVAQYFRVYRRGYRRYRRHYRRYRRYYNRYSRYYNRYSRYSRYYNRYGRYRRGYGRYARFYARF
jgi:hypothetical protein